MMSYIKGGEKMYEGCNCGGGIRNFLTKEEKLEILSEYKKSLEQEAKGIEERIQELKKKNS